ncbi:MAG: CusA/CzcA family heavy metal efflux RND transporter [candidate division Zixibacteria bacterium]|nr:CusA/CzcA family heavy metal efflux RND transporter [candidate division Zixibacteria bacterium]MBU1471496.1 CusA/CzcA family heavy metal efflux RND transporter [candidate division Zixibacteria bacterium]MBU2625526.1 CusA/CzcA family heavy metal efflux RND transporter [candidate division Zixibacteria bacterium]
MLKHLVEFTLRYRFVVLALAGFLCLLGLIALWHLPFDAFPDTTPVLVQVNCAAPGWAPEDLERLVTYPIEQAVTGLTGLAEVRSITKYGLCQITAIFEDNVDLYLARQQVNEKMLGVEVPDGVGLPQLGPVSTGLGEVFHYIVIGKTTDITEPRSVQDWIIKPQLQSVPGVAEVNSWGGFKKQYLVQVDPVRLAGYELSIADIAATLRNELGNVPGGQVVRGGELTLIRGIGTVESIDEIEQIVVASPEGVPITVRDIGDVTIGHEWRRGAATFNGLGEGVLGLGFMITGENPAEVTARLSERLDEAAVLLTDSVQVVPVYERTDLVEQVLTTVEHNLIFGALLVIAVLFVFLGNLRAGLIVASAIPISMLFAFDLMSRVGVAGSLMSLGAIDFGLAVDNAVIQVENSVRRLSQSDAGASRMSVLRDAILEVRKPTLFGELIIIIVYLPILTLQGVEGKLFRPMALTVVFVLTGSLILSFTVLPAMIGTFLKKSKHERELLVIRWLRNIYRPILDRALRYSRTVLLAALVLLVGGVLLFTQLGSEFVPRLSEGTIVINFVRLAGISLEESVRYNTQIEQNILGKFPDEIEYIWTRIGTAELSTDPMGLELSDMFMSLKPRSEWTKASTQQELVAAIDAELADLPGQNRIFTQPIEMRVNEMLAGIRSDIGIKLFGDDLEALEAKADEIAALVRLIPGNADVSVEQLTGQPQLRLQVDRQRLAKFGLTAAEVLTAIESIGGVVVGDVFEGQRRFDLVVQTDTSRFAGPEDISQIFLRSKNNSIVGLDRVTKATLGDAPGSITREWSKRRIVVQCNVRGRDMGSFVSELRERIGAEIDLPNGYFVRLGGQFENLERARTRLMLVVPISLLLIFGLLFWTYKSALDALLIFSGVPMAALGGVVVLALRGMPFSISAGVGFIALSGIAVLNGLVLVSTIKRLRSEGIETTNAVREAALTRLRPVFMTALVAALGFVPMAISTGVGAEVQRPLATVVVGGILTSTALTLIILPALYVTFGKRTESEK